MKMHVIEVVPNLVTLITPIRYIYHFTFGEQLPEEETGNSTLITVRYEISDKLFPSNADSQHVFHYFMGASDNDELYYSRLLFYPFKVSLRLRGLRTGQPSIAVNKLYTRFPLRVNNIFPPGAHLTDIITVKLLNRGWVPLSAACIAVRGKALILLGPPDTGKTLTVIQGFKQGLPFNFMSEDIIITNGNQAVACPYTISFRHHGYLGGAKEDFLARLHSISPIFNFITKRLAGHLDKFFKDMPFTPQAEIGCVVILQRAGKEEEGIKALNPSEAAHRILQLNRYEFTYYRNPLLRVYEYFNPKVLSLEKLQYIENTIIRKLSQDHAVYQITASDAKDFLRYLKTLLHK